MFGARRLRFVGCSALLVTLASGCHLFCRDRPITVLAKDAETGVPVPGAAVKVAYYQTSAPFAPSDVSGETGKDGVARLSAAPDEFGVSVKVAAAGYLSEEKFVSGKVMEA